MIELYEAKLIPVREKFSSQLDTLYKQGKGDTLSLFMINYCSQGVGMTKSVSDWITRSGEKCVKLGYKELGNELISHAKHEAGHENYMINDTKALVEWWNKNHEKKLDASQILKRASNPGVLAYQKLHEDCIGSDSPYGQIAIEYEIEKVSVDHGPSIMKFCASQMGPDVLKKLSFIAEHVALDVGHTAYNKKALNNFLVKNPQALQKLVQFGTLALETYGQFLADCMANISSQQQAA